MAVERRLSMLIEPAAAAARELLLLAARHGLPVRVWETYRTYNRQMDLYAQGRTQPGNIVTWTMRSRHLTGRALDLVWSTKDTQWSWEEPWRGAWIRLGELGETCGFIWGGRWRYQDKPHFEWPEIQEV